MHLPPLRHILELLVLDRPQCGVYESMECDPGRQVSGRGHPQWWCEQICCAAVTSLQLSANCEVEKHHLSCPFLQF